MIPTGGCALETLLAGGDPIGTATPFDHLFLLQLPPPWERIALHTPGVPPNLKHVQVAATRLGLSVHALLIDGGAPLPVESVRLLHYSRAAEGEHPNYQAREFILAAEKVAGVMEALLEDANEIAGELSIKPKRDLLMCTHGERDDCCGRFGEAAFEYVRDRYAGQNLRVWRTSHFGGHRFAPTMVDLPDGRCWGWLSEAAIDNIIGSKGQVADLERNYRGCCAVASEAQCAERDLFIAHGWSWRRATFQVKLEASRQSTEESSTETKEAKPTAGATGKDNRRTYVAEILFSIAGRSPESRTALIEHKEGAPAPASCGAIPRNSTTYSCEWVGELSPQCYT